MDATMKKGLLWGSVATIVALIAILACGNLPHGATPRYSCLCPDSGAIDSPRGLTAH